MVDFCVFNELSLPLNEHKAKEQFGLFFALLKDLKDKDLNQIRMSDDFKNYNILKNVSLSKFIGKQEKEFQSRLKNFISNGVIKTDTPIIKQDNTDQVDTLNRSEYFFKNNSTDGGLACCDIWNTIAISFKTNNKWGESEIDINKQIMDNNCSINESEIHIKHASLQEHLKTHSNFFNALEKEKKLKITQSNFWENRKINFPQKIIFCKEVEDNIKNLDPQVFKSAISILRDIETGRKKPRDYNYSGESKSVKGKPKLENLRMFTIGDNKEFIENHIKSLPNKNRIYFLEKENKIHIGYIGIRLPT